MPDPDEPNIVFSSNLFVMLRISSSAKRGTRHRDTAYSLWQIHSDADNRDHAAKPINPYGRGKLMVERIREDFGHAHGLQSVSHRYFNAAGADPDAEVEEDHNPETHLVPLALA